MKPYSMDGSIIYCILKNDTKWQKDILQNLEEIYKEYTKRSIGFELQILTLLFSTWNMMVRNYFVSFSSDNVIYNTSRIKTIINYVHNHYSEKINLDDIAYKCGFASASYFIEKFKLQTGMSPFIYRKKKQSKK